MKTLEPREIPGPPPAPPPPESVHSNLRGLSAWRCVFALVLPHQLLCLLPSSAFLQLHAGPFLLVRCMYTAALGYCTRETFPSAAAVSVAVARIEQPVPSSSSSSRSGCCCCSFFGSRSCCCLSSSSSLQQQQHQQEKQRNGLA